MENITYLKYIISIKKSKQFTNKNIKNKIISNNK